MARREVRSLLIIGLTGGIASGKSTVSRVLRELGAPVIDSDLVAKEVVRPGTDAWLELVEAFGREILIEDESIDRRKLGNKVFADPSAVKRLNAITHPRILDAIAERLGALSEPAGRYPGVVIDAPVLIEAGMLNMVDEVWLVVVDEKTQIQRLMARDHFGLEQAMNRINAQIPLQDKRRYADVIIDNTGSVRETRAQVKRLWEQVARQGGNGCSQHYWRERPID